MTLWPVSLQLRKNTFVVPFTSTSESIRQNLLNAPHFYDTVVKVQTCVQERLRIVSSVASKKLAEKNQFAKKNLQLLPKIIFLAQNRPRWNQHLLEISLFIFCLGFEPSQPDFQRSLPSFRTKLESVFVSRWQRLFWQQTLNEYEYKWTS